MSNPNCSLIIPTLNRVKDLEITLNSLLWLSISPFETIIVDQSDTQDTKHLCAQEKYKQLKIKYHHTAIKSSALARNIAIKNSNPLSNYIIFLDDDVTLAKDFLEQIHIFFTHHPKAKWWVANIESPLRKTSLLKKIGFMVLTWGNKFSEMFVTNWGFNCMPLTQNTSLKTIERTSGCWMFFRKEVLDEWYTFEERFMKYSLMEDCFLSYSINQNYPKSLYFVPSVHMIHHETPASRIPNKARILQNIVHRYYFIKKFKKSTVAYLRTMLIFCIFDLMNYRDIRVIWWYMKWLTYIFNKRNQILNPDFDFNTFIFG